MEKHADQQKTNPPLPRLQQLPAFLVGPPLLDGSQGTNREKSQANQLRATNDYEAIQSWLNEYHHRPATYRTYQKEIERFLLWSIYQQQKPLSSLDRADLDLYLVFLDDPQPRQIWCGTKGGRHCKVSVLGTTGIALKFNKLRQ